MIQPIVKNIFRDIDLSFLKQPRVKIRYRQFLPGSHSTNMPEYLTKPLPKDLKVLQFGKPSVSTLPNKTIAEECRRIFDTNLNQTPAILIKGLPINTVEDFDNFTVHLGYDTLHYKGGSGYRKKHLKNIYAASDEPDVFTIEPHNEMSYMKIAPSKILFGCIKNSSIGGESPIVFNRDILRNLDEYIVDKFVQKQVRYSRNLPHERDSNYITWQATFSSKSKEEAEIQMTEQGFNWRWNKDESLTLWQTLPAMRVHPHTGEMVWFNQIQANHCSYYRAHPDYVGRENLPPHEYHYHCSYGDGEEIEDDVMDHMRSVIWRNAAPLKLEKSDVLLLDNYLCQHTRMGYAGEREFVVQLIQ